MRRSVLAALAAVALAAAACGGSGEPVAPTAGTSWPTVPPTPTPAVDHEALVRVCLYDSVAAYPTWPQPDQSVLDTLPSCRDLPQADKTRLRQLMAAFVTESNRRS